MNKDNGDNILYVLKSGCTIVGNKVTTNADWYIEQGFYNWLD